MTLEHRAESSGTLSALETVVVKSLLDKSLKRNIYDPWPEWLYFI
jgi:hypothetical protein